MVFFSSSVLNTGTRWWEPDSILLCTSYKLKSLNIEIAGWALMIPHQHTVSFLPLKNFLYQSSSLATQHLFTELLYVLPACTALAPFIMQLPIFLHFKCTSSCSSADNSFLALKIATSFLVLIKKNLGIRKKSWRVRFFLRILFKVKNWEAEAEDQIVTTFTCSEYKFSRIVGVTDVDKVGGWKWAKILN